MAQRTKSTTRQLKFSEPPLRGFLIHLCVYVVVIAGLAAINLTKNPSHPWFLWVLVAWGIALAVHDVILLVEFRDHASPSSTMESDSKPKFKPKRGRQQAARGGFEGEGEKIATLTISVICCAAVIAPASASASDDEVPTINVATRRIAALLETAMSSPSTASISLL